MARFWAKIEGGEALRKALRAKADEFVAEVKLAMPDEGARLQGAANAKAPTESGALLASSQLNVEPDATGVRVAVAYGDEKAPAVHEGVHHNKKVKGTRGFKWLEYAFNAFEAGALERVIGRLRKITQG